MPWTRSWRGIPPPRRGSTSPSLICGPRRRAGPCTRFFAGGARAACGRARRSATLVSRTTAPKPLVGGGCARAVNLKLMKHGGLYRAAEVNAVCESAGLPTMVGCMGESVVSVAAGLHFALANGNVRWADLDSHMALVRDVAPALRFEAGDLVAPSTAGLGVRADALFG